MKSSRILLSVAAALAAVSVLVAAGCGGGQDDVPADAVAVIDGTPITKAQLDELMKRARASYTGTFPKAGTAEFQSLQSQAVLYLVQREEYAREAKDRGIEVTDAQIAQKLDELKKQYFNGSQKKLEAQLKQQDYTMAALKADIVAQLVSEGIAKQLTSDVKVTPDDVKSYYKENAAKYTTAKSRSVRHILVKTKAEADSIYGELENGADFAAIAKAKSLDPGSKDVGGKLTVSAGQTVAPFDKVAFALAVNEISKPVKTEYGYHVIQALTPVKEGSTTPLADVQATIKAQLLADKKNSAVSDWATEIQKKYESKVQYAAGFAPPATDTTATTG